jgi:2-hydroxychromene-2-carboxylate isomerase
MSNKVEYFLDCSSPWTYLSFRGMEELLRQKSFEIIWKPILVGGIFNTINPSVYESRQNPIKEKLVYSQKDLNDWSKSRGLDIKMPKVFPVNSVKAMRGSFFFQDEGNIEDYLDAVFYAYWTEGKDISDDDILKSIVNKLDGSEEEYFDFIKSPEAKERLISNTQELIDRGGFGSPTFFLNDDDMYFGNDRIQLLKEKL